jgi:hypothetical protein
MRKSLSLIEMYRGCSDDVKRSNSRAATSRPSGARPRSVVPSPSAAVGLLVALTLGSCLAVPRDSLAQAQCEPLGNALTPAASPASRSFSCRFDATLTRTFTPTTVAKDTYRAYVTDAPIEEVLAAFRSVANSGSVRGAWAIEQMEALDAFGRAGQYDETRVARLYAGRRARVAHGPIIRDGRTVASITLVSPHPDPSLTHLDRGTLIIEYKIVVSSE